MKDINILGQYTVPLGENQVTILFTGEKLTPADFDALEEFVRFARTQLERGQKAENPDKPKEAQP